MSKKSKLAKLAMQNAANNPVIAALVNTPVNTPVTPVQTTPSAVYVAPVGCDANPLDNAFELAFPNVRERAAFRQVLANSIRETGGSQFLVIDTGTTPDRILVLSGCVVSKTAEPFIREFSWKDDAGKTHLRVIRVSIHRNAIKGVLAYPTLCRETSNQARYDKLMGRSLATAVKPVVTPVQDVQPIATDTPVQDVETSALETAAS